MCENEPKRIKNSEERAVKNSPIRSPKENNSSEDSASGTEFAKTVI